MGRKRELSELNKLLVWTRRQPLKVKIILGIMAVVSVLAGLDMFVEDHNHFFIASEAIHAAGILVLIYKLSTKRNCSGLFLFLYQNIHHSIHFIV